MHVLGNSFLFFMHEAMCDMALFLDALFSVAHVLRFLISLKTFAHCSLYSAYFLAHILLCCAQVML